MQNTWSNRIETVAAVASLSGLRADDMARWFLAIGCKGTPGSIGRCPIAIHLSRRTGATVHVNGRDCWEFQGGFGSSITLSPAAMEFQARFDKGEWPELVG